MSALFRPSFGYKRENLGAEEAGKSGKSGRAASETDNAVVAARSPALEDVLGVTHPTERSYIARRSPLTRGAQQSPATVYAPPVARPNRLDTEQCDKRVPRSRNPHLALLEWEYSKW
jgi:hypothetical protein